MRGWAGTIATLLLLAPLQPALAQPLPEATLLSAACDGLRKTVRLEVRNLGAGALRPAVFLEGHDQALMVREVADDHIVAVMPANLGDAAYRLRLRLRGDAWLEVPLILGIVGPVIID